MKFVMCPFGCGCRLGTEDADAAECACDGPCCVECAENGYPDAPSYFDIVTDPLKWDDTWGFVNLPDDTDGE